MGFRCTTVALMLAACSACDVLEPEREIPASRPDGPRLVMLNDSQFAVDFRTYDHDQNLREADWTAISRYTTGTTPHLGDWRARDITGGLNDRAAVLVDPPLASLAGAALRWDSLPVLSPPLEILTHVWFPPVENHPRVGLGWFIQEPDSTGQFIGYAIIRNYTSPAKNGFDMYRMVRIGGGGWFGPGDDGMEGGGWAWIRMRHTIGESSGTIQYRAWAGALEDEPQTWDFEETSTWFGPHGGTHGPNISGGVGLFAMGHENMAGAALMWDAFTIGINGAPAPPPPQPNPDIEFSVSVSCSGEGGAVPQEVVRGGLVSCAASWSMDTIPASEIHFAWSFKGDSVRVFPEEGALPYPPPGPIDSVGFGVARWEGPAVLAGDVSVTATWQGNTDADTTTFSVAARTGPDWQNLRVNYDSSTIINAETLLGLSLVMNGTVFRFGANVDSILGSDGSTFERTIRGTPVLEDVTIGPNAGLSYVQDIGDVRSTRVREILTWLNGTEDPMFRYRRFPRERLTNLRALIEMRTSPANGAPLKFPNATEFRDGVLAHEGRGRNGGRGHQGQIELGATFSCGRAPYILERVVGFGRVIAEERVDDVVTEAWKSIAHGSSHEIVHSNYSNAPYYEVVDSFTDIDERYPNEWYDGDRPIPMTDTDAERLAPNTEWNCQRGVQ